jgi:hypothetical protein
VKFINLSTKGDSFSMVLDPTLNGENMRFWLTLFIEFVFAHFLSIWHEEDIIEKLKARSFRILKNLAHTQSNSDTIARWSTITCFLIHPVHLIPMITKMSDLHIQYVSICFKQNVSTQMVRVSRIYVVLGWKKTDRNIDVPLVRQCTNCRSRTSWLIPIIFPF